eukprot:SAG31_NODE_506_length_14749_cov_8.119181_12_plen_81_part_00
MASASDRLFTRALQFSPGAKNHAQLPLAHLVRSMVGRYEEDQLAALRNLLPRHAVRQSSAQLELNIAKSTARFSKVVAKL